MSHYDYTYSLEISRKDPPFYGLIMAAISKADSSNYEKLRSTFPEVWNEFQIRYHSPGGCLDIEEHEKIHNNGKKYDRGIHEILQKRFLEERRRIQQQLEGENDQRPGDFVEGEFT